MPSAINSDNGVVSGTAGLKSSADSSGVLDLQTNGTTAISISASQVVSFANQPTYTGGTANGVMFLNGSKAVTTGTALTFDGNNLSVGAQGEVRVYNTANTRYGRFVTTSDGTVIESFNGAGEPLILSAPQSSAYIGFKVNAAEQGRWNTTGLGIGITNPAYQLQMSGGTTVATRIQLNRGSDDTAQNLRLGWNAIKTTRTSNSLSTAQTNLDFVQVGSDGERTCFSMGTNGSLEVNLGIKFPATQAASADANTLDDYEEGTWSPIYTGGAISVTYSEQTGRYVKIGKMVYISCRLVTTTASGGSGVLRVGGLPFTSSASSNPGFTSINFSYNWASTAILDLIPTPSSTLLDAYTQYAGFNDNTQVGVTALTNSGTVYLIFGGCYEAAA